MKKNIIKKLSIATAFLLFSDSSNASVNLIVDGDFSGSNVTPSNYAYSNNIKEPNWSFSDGSGISNHAYQWGSAAKNNSVAFLQYDGSKPTDTPTIFQIFTNSSNAFRLSFDMAQRDNHGGTESLDVTVDGKTIVADLPAGTGSLNSYLFNITGLTGSSHKLEFQGVNPSQSDSSLLLTNVNVTAVPEPETYALMLVGLGPSRYTQLLEHK